MNVVQLMLGIFLYHSNWAVSELPSLFPQPGAKLGGGGDTLRKYESSGLAGQSKILNDRM